MSRHFLIVLHVLILVDYSISALAYQCRGGHLLRRDVLEQVIHQHTFL